MESVRQLAQRQRDAGLPDVGDPVCRFHHRPFFGILPEVIETVTASIAAAGARPPVRHRLGRAAQ